MGVGVTAADQNRILDSLLMAASLRAPLIVEHLAVNNLIIAVRQQSFRNAINQFDLVAADGQGVRWALKLLGDVELQDRVTARELMLAICERSALSGFGIYLYGDESRTVTRLQMQLLRRFPGLRIVGAEASIFRPLTVIEDRMLVERINASGAQFVFVALGCPLQERFVFEHRHQIHAIQLCVGSAFKFIAGERRIAPRWMQRYGLEWLHRLILDPRKLFLRYLDTNSAFLYLLIIEYIRSRFNRGAHFRGKD